MKNIVKQTLALSIFLVCACHTSNTSQDNPVAATALGHGQQGGNAKVPQYAEVVIQGHDPWRHLTTEFRDCKLPERIADLGATPTEQLYQLSRRDSLTARHLGFTGKLNDRTTVWVKDYTYRVKADCDGPIFFGVGLRLFITYQATGQSVPNDLGKLAEAVNEHTATAAYDLCILSAWPNQRPLSDIPSSGIFDTGALAHLDGFFKAYRQLIGQAGKDRINPTELPN